MLILTRKAEQGIVIDGTITVRLLSIDGERVKIGIDAPRAVTVLREELLVEVADQNQEAARGRGRRDLTKAFQGLERRHSDPQGPGDVEASAS